ncbi:MAG: biopolymer transporter ExbD [Pseudomonadota bacterium]
MKFGRDRAHQRVAEISVVPLIDLFLNILVFFLVATTFGADSVFFVELPETSQRLGVADAKQVLISVSSKGEISVNNHRVSHEALQTELEQVSAERRKKFPVVIRADKSALHGSVVSVIDVVRRVGFENVGMATKVEPER